MTEKRDRDFHKFAGGFSVEVIVCRAMLVAASGGCS